MHDIVIKNKDRFKEICRGIFTHNRAMIEAHPDIFAYVPNFANHTWCRSRGIFKKTKHASVVNSGKAWLPGHHFRNAAVERIVTIDPKVEVFGKKTNPFHRKEDVLIDYRFSYTIENAAYDTYITEKLMDCFAVGTIPIYHGCDDAWRMFEGRGILRYDDSFDPAILTEDFYRSLVPYAEENLERLMKTVRMADDVLYDEVQKRL